MGESAGGGSILYLLTSPVEASRKTPLFQKAILQSPGPYPDRGVTQNRMIYQRFLELSGADSIEVARAAPAETLRKANLQIVLDAPYGQFNFGTCTRAFFFGGSRLALVHVSHSFVCQSYGYKICTDRHLMPVARSCHR